jgi:hypothetical protein
MLKASNVYGEANQGKNYCQENFFDANFVLAAAASCPIECHLSQICF